MKKKTPTLEYPNLVLNSAQEKIGKLIPQTQTRTSLLVVIEDNKRKIIVHTTEINVDDGEKLPLNHTIVQAFVHQVI